MNYYNDNTTVYLNGDWIKASTAKTDLYSQTMHYGCGVFEGIRAYQTEDGVRVFKAEEHYERLLYSAKKMHLKFDYTVEQLVSLTYELLEQNKLKDAYIRPLIYVDAYMHLTPADSSNLFICAWEWDNLFSDKFLEVMVSSFQRPNPKSCFVDAKVTGHYTNSLLATNEAKVKGYDEALLLDMNGNIAEGPGANFFYEKDGKLYTCPTGNILPGITRQTMFELAKELEVEIIEEFFTPDDVKGADGAFFTGTAAEVTGINWRKQASLGSVFDYSFLQVTRQKLAMVVSREPVCKTCNHDPINMLTEELRALNSGEVSAEEVDKLRQSLRDGSQEIDVALGELLKYGDRHPEGMLPANVIPVVATN